MTTELHQAAAQMYQAMVTHPRCTCLRAGFWPFRKQALVDGKWVDPPDVICASCKSMRRWEALELARLA